MIPNTLDYLSGYVPDRFARSLRWRVQKYFPEYVNRGVVVKVDRAQWRVFPKDNVTERLLFLHRAYAEPESVTALKDTVRGKRVLFFDIGANCGMYSVALALEADASSRFLSFEPNPAMVQRLKENIRLNEIEDIVQVQEVALAAEEGVAVLGLAENFGESSLVGAEHGIEVQTKPLAAFADPDETFDVRLLKIDVEGFEAEVLLPFFEVAKKSVWPSLIMMETEHADSWSADVTGHLAKLGYSEIFSAEGNTLFELVG